MIDCADFQNFRENWCGEHGYIFVFAREILPIKNMAKLFPLCENISLYASNRIR